MKILLRIAVIAAVAALAAGCCKCRSYQKKNRRPLIGTEWQLIQLDGRAVKPEEGKFYVMFLAEENRFAGVGACNRLMGKYETTDKGALRIGPILDDDGLPGHGTGGRLHQGARSHHALRYGRADAAAARRRRAESRIPGQTLKQRSEKIGNRGRFK